MKAISAGCARRERLENLKHKRELILRFMFVFISLGRVVYFHFVFKFFFSILFFSFM